MPEGVIDQPSQSAQGSQAGPSDWRTFLNDDLKADPVVSSWAEKASEKDVPSIIKGYAHSTKRMGNVIPMPGKDAKPEELDAIRTRLYEAGIMAKPPADPKEYGIAKPEKLPDGTVWNDELANALASTLHKHGAKKELAGELLQLYEKALTGAQTAFKSSTDAGMAELKAVHGDKFDERWDAAKRMVPSIFSTPDEIQLFNDLGLGDHPGFMSVLLKLAPLAMQDSSYLRDIPQKGGEMSLEDAQTQARDIMTNKENPLHEKWKKGDPEAMNKIDELYRKAVGNAPVEIGGSALRMG